jgi:hypothetical protein
LHLASGIVGLTAESGFSGGSQLLAVRAGPGQNATTFTAARPLAGNETLIGGFSVLRSLHNG